jgi:hypothetical protein
MNLVSFCAPYPDGENLVDWRASLPKNGIQVVACKTLIKPSSEHIDWKLYGTTDEMIALEMSFPSMDKDFDFSLVRNLMDEHATSEWIIHMDSDERLAIPHDEFWEIMYTLDKSEADCAYLSIGGITHESKVEGPVRRRYNHPNLRIHRKSAGLRWKGICHETLDIGTGGITTADTDILLYHKGYAIEKDEMLSKCTRNAKLLVREYQREDSQRNWQYLVKTFNLIHNLTR